LSRVGVSDEKRRGGGKGNCTILDLILEEKKYPRHRRRVKKGGEGRACPYFCSIGVPKGGKRNEMPRLQSPERKKGSCRSLAAKRGGKRKEKVGMRSTGSGGRLVTVSTKATVVEEKTEVSSNNRKKGEEGGGSDAFARDFPKKKKEAALHALEGGEKKKVPIRSLSLKGRKKKEDASIVRASEKIGCKWG